MAGTIGERELLLHSDVNDERYDEHERWTMDDGHHTRY